MYQIDSSGSVPIEPTPGAVGTPGWFTGGNPSTGTPATILDADWFNALQSELVNILTAAGITQSKTNSTQILQAIQTLTGPGRLLRTVVYMYVGGVQMRATVTEGVWTAFSATGATTYAPGTGTVVVEHECQAPGGGGGGCSPSSGSATSVSGGGSAGTYAKSLIPVSALAAPVAVTLGVPGVGGTPGNSGGSGTAASLGTLVSCPGGIGSSNCAAGAGTFFSGGTGMAGVPTGPYIVEACQGGPGSYGLQLAPGSSVAGPGGTSAFGPGPGGPSSTGNGVTAMNFGTGGSGANSGISNAAGATGALGASPIQIMREFS